LTIILFPTHPIYIYLVLLYIKDRHWSIPLTAAFAFADSLTFGACGHKAIQLDLTSWNTLIKVCCYRGSLWRAIEILNETMPRNGISPDTISYNTILAGLARVVSFFLFSPLANIEISIPDILP